MQDVVYDLASLSEVSPRAYLNLSVENSAEDTEPTHTVTNQSREYKSMFLKQSTYTDFYYGTRPKLLTCMQLRSQTSTVTSTQASPGYGKAELTTPQITSSVSLQGGRKAKKNKQTTHTTPSPQR